MKVKADQQRGQNRADNRDDNQARERDSAVDLA